MFVHYDLQKGSMPGNKVFNKFAIKAGDTNAADFNVLVSKMFFQVLQKESELES